jgi:hypothetical protein
MPNTMQVDSSSAIGARPGVVHFLHATRAIVAHAGHDHAQRIASGDLRHGAEQDIDRWLVPIHQGAVGDFDVVLGAAAPQHHVAATGGDQGAAGHDAVAVLCFAHFQLAQAVEAVGKHGGEFFRHVLDDDDAAAHVGQFRQHRLQGLGAAGRGADGDDAVGGFRHGARAGGLGGKHGVGGQLGWRRQRAPCAARDVAHVGSCRGAHGRDQVVAGVLEELLDPQLGLGDDRQRAGGQRVHGRAGALFRQRGTDDGRRRMLAHDLLEEGQAVHARHLDVDHEHIGPLDLHLVQRIQRVGSNADHLDVGFALQRLAVDLADHRRVVDDHDFDSIAHDPAPPLQIARTGTANDWKVRCTNKGRPSPCKSPKGCHSLPGSRAKTKNGFMTDYAGNR